MLYRPPEFWPPDPAPAGPVLAHGDGGLDAFCHLLLARNLLSPYQLIQWRRRGQVTLPGLIRFLVSYEVMTADRAYQALSECLGAPRILPLREGPDPRLLDRLGAREAIGMELLPWRHVGGVTLILAADPGQIAQHRPRLEALFGPIAPALAPWPEIEATIHRLRGAALAGEAESASPPDRSSRGFDPVALRRHALLVLGLLVIDLAAGRGLLPALAFAITLLATIAFNALKLGALILSFIPPRQPLALPLAEGDLPMMTLLVPLLHEEAIARHLVRRIGRLDYPADKLEILLVVEDNDRVTRATLDRADLTPAMRVVTVPGGTIRTKPRALNYAMDHARGQIIGIYDAEDAPEPDHLRRIAARFAEAGPDLACIQGVLDFYNSDHNWMSRCFTVEYAAWFRLLLPGIARMGMVVPLGGTTLFLRRSAIEALGRWDAHNVTEDADLGLRIARAGLRTELMDITTYEEANSHPLAWIKQRSRWSKGFMMTWISHHRDPARLWADLGPWRFAGVQMMLAGSVIQSLFAPLLWSLWLVPLGFGHPVLDRIAPAVATPLFALFLGVEVLLMLVGLRALGRTGHRLSPLWVPTMVLYYPLATAAAWKALWELFWQPHFWDKTSHGAFSPDAEAEPVLRP